MKKYKKGGGGKQQPPQEWCRCAPPLSSRRRLMRSACRLEIRLDYKLGYGRWSNVRADLIWPLVKVFSLWGLVSLV